MSTTTDVDPNDFLMGGVRVRSASFKQVGDKVVGHIMRKPETRQQQDPVSKELKFWKDGRPMLQVRVVLMTEEHEDAEDSGERAIFIRGQMREAVARAISAAKAPGLEVGGKLQVKYVANGEAKPPLSAPKLFEAQYRPPEAVALPEAPAATNEVESEVPF